MFRRHLSLAAAAGALALLLAFALPAQTESPAEPAAPTADAGPTPDATPALTPGRLAAQAADFGACFAQNYQTLNRLNWRHGARLAGRCLGAALLDSLLFLAAGLLAGVLVWALVRRLGGFTLPYRWYACVRWAWAGVFPLCFALGAAYAGGWFGAGRFLERQVRDERLLDGLVWNTGNAAVLAALDYRVTGDETPEQLLALIAQAEHLDLAINPAWRARLDEWTAAYCQAWYARLVLGAGRRWLDERLGALLQLRGVQPRFLLVRLLPPAARDAYVGDHPEARATLAAADVALARVRRETCVLIRSMVLPHVLGGLSLGVAVPLLLLAGVRLGDWLCRLVARAWRAAQPPRPPALPAA